MLRNYDYLLKKKVTRTYPYKVASGFHLLQNMLLATSTFSKEEIICPKPFNKAVQKYLKSVLVHEYRKYMVKYKKKLLFLFFASRFEKENKRSELNTENDLFEILLSEEYVLDKLDFYLLAARFRIPLKVTGMQPNLFLERWKEAEQKKKIQEKKEELEEKKELEELEKEEELEEKKEEIEEKKEKEEEIEELKEKEENKEISFFWKDASYFYFELHICDDDAKIKKKEYKLTVVDKLFSETEFSSFSSSSFFREKKKEYKNKIPNIKNFFSSFLILPNKTEKKKKVQNTVLFLNLPEKKNRLHCKTFKKKIF